MPSNDHFTNRLTEAGRRAANQSGAVAPPMDSIRVEVARRQRSQRRLTGVVSVLALVAIIPIAAFFFGRGGDEASVVTAASNAEPAVGDASSQVPAGAAEEPSAALNTGAGDTDTLAAQDQDFDVDLDENVNIQIQVGELSYSVEVIVDDQASVRGAEAEASADETRVINETTIWLRDVGDQTEASALIDDDIFAAAVGPRDEVIDALDDLTEFAEIAAPFLDGERGIDGLPGEGFDPESFFEDRELPFDPEAFFGEDFDPESFLEDRGIDPESFFGEDFDPESYLEDRGIDPESYLEDGEFPIDPESFFEDGELPFDPEAFFEDGEFPIDPEAFFGEDLDLDDLFGQLQELEECFGPALEDAEATGNFVFPECDLAS